MSNLSAFFAENAIQEEGQKYVASKRFVENGKPVEWELKAISSELDSKLRKDYTIKEAVPNKRNQFMQVLDANGYSAALAVATTVYPDLQNSKLQDNYGVMGAEELLKKMLKAGEYQNYLSKVQEINGFNESMDELVEEAKN